MNLSENHQPDGSSEMMHLRARLADAEEALRAIRMGEVDALVGHVSGEPQLFVLQSSDVESNRFHSEILSKVNDAVLVFDPDGYVTYLNVAAERQYDVSPSNVLGSHVSLLFENRWELPEHEQQALRALDEEGHWKGESLHVRRDGTVLHVESSANRISDPDGGHAGFLHVIRDISQRRESEAALRNSEARYRALFNSIDEGFCLIEMIFDGDDHPVDYRFLHVSPSFEHQSGLSDVVGRTMKEMHPAHESFWFETYGRVALTGEPVRIQHEAAELGRWFDVYASSFGEKENRQVAVVFNNITFRIRAEEQMRRTAEALAAADRRKDEFLAMLAHELRNPLAPMLPGVEVLMMRPDDPAIVTQVGAMLRRQVGQMSRLIEDLLDMSRVTTGKIGLKKSKVSLAAVLEQAIESVQPLIANFRHELVAEKISDNVQIDADPHRLAQVVSNLLSNAAKYTPPGGKIVLTVLHDPREGFRISVKDNGKGITPEQQATIFDLFDQGSDGAADGLGIGLTLVRSLVEMHGGSVSVSSEGVGKGSEFIVRLPQGITVIPEANLGDARMDDTTGERKIRVLIADDGKPTADILAMFFRLEGMETAVAYDGRQAIEAAKTFRPQLVCLDLGMPEVDGFEAARRIREMNRDAYLVALSGWGTEKDRMKTAEAGFNEHLTKPVKPSDLRDLMDRLFSTSAAG